MIGVIRHFDMDLVNFLRVRMIRNRWFSDDVLADTSVSVREEVPVLALQILMDKGVPLVTPVVDQDV